MKILITGGTGFIGSALCENLSNQGHQVVVLSRTRQGANYVHDLSALDAGYAAIINLAGEPLNKRRWNKKVKREIYASRMATTQAVIDYIRAATIKPKVLLSGSAIGFYGSSLQREFCENDAPEGADFAHDLCRDWEQKAAEAGQYGVRVCLLRTGIVLGKGGGALHAMMLPFKLGLGAVLGDGKQWMGWIHMQDVLGAIDLLLQDDSLNGPFNLTAPTPVTNQDFSKLLAGALKRPLLLAMPALIAELLFGEMAKILLIRGQKVLPSKLIASKYQFKYPDLKAALVNIVGS